MTRYFFDIDTDGAVIRDEVGVEVDGLDGMRRAAIAALPDIARDEPPEGDHRIYTVQVRDPGGRRLLKACLTLDVRWLDGRKG